MLITLLAAVAALGLGAFFGLALAMLSAGSSSLRRRGHKGEKKWKIT